MGTLSYTYGKPYGYLGKPGTCHWCGDPLRYERREATAADEANPTYQRGDAYSRPTIAVARGGYRGNGIFCSLRCGYQWAVHNFPG